MECSILVENPWDPAKKYKKFKINIYNYYQITKCNVVPHIKNGYQSYSTCLLIIYFILREGGDHIFSQQVLIVIAPKYHVIPNDKQNVSDMPKLN